MRTEVARDAASCQKSPLDIRTLKHSGSASDLK